jgi:hypothetical protein
VIVEVNIGDSQRGKFTASDAAVDQDSQDCGVAA